MTLLKKYDCFSDGIPSDLSRLDVRFPGSKFILQVRDLNTWILSRLGHIQRAKARGNFVSHELWDDTKHSVREWIFQRNRFHFFVMSYFSKRPDDFLLVNYIRDGNAQQKIARFLGFQGTARRPSENVNVARANSAHEDLLHAVAAELSIPDHELRFDLFQPSLLGCCFKNVFPVDTGDL